MVIEKTVCIDWFDEVKPEVELETAVVAIDVIRATTTAITAAALGRKVYPVSSLDEARDVARGLKNPLMVGELGGNMPYGFDLQNSPILVEEDRNPGRPVVLLSTSGTRLITEYRRQPALFVACLRNYSSLTVYLSATQSSVALIGAGTRGEFREEDQLCAAWIAEGLMRAGFKAADVETKQIISRWKHASPEVLRQGNSAAYLMRSGQERDLDFILSHIDDLHNVFQIQRGELVEVSPVAAGLNGREKIHG